MSGARALASARRRRAEPPPNNVISSSSKMTNNATSINDEQPNDSMKPKMSPAMMLLSHNKIIENLQTIIENLNNKVEDLENKIKTHIEQNGGETNSDDSEYYKNKIQVIDNNLEEIKKHTLKVQTFSMETNLQLVEIKKKINKYDKKEQDNEDKQREKIIEHINKVSTILTNINCHVEQGKESQNIQNNTLIDILQGVKNNITGENIIRDNVNDGSDIDNEQDEPEVETEPIEDDEPEVETELIEDDENMIEDGEDTTQLNF